ncbi:MAG: GNAT family N-acetyltransferase [Saprospiraceae bacterium]
MLSYKKINQAEASNWNINLQKTDASFFQYPYFGAGYKYLPKGSVSFYELYEDDQLIGFTSCLNINILFIKIGLILRGPVLLQEHKAKETVSVLKKILKKERYFFIRVNPNRKNESLVNALESDKKILKIDAFPIYKGSQGFDFAVNKVDGADKILESYKPRARQNIRYAQEENFDFVKSNDLDDLKNVYDMFLKVSDKKEFAYRSFNSYKEIIQNGALYNLCMIYLAKKNGIVVNAAIIVKDKNTFNYFSGGMIDGDYRPRNSPSTLLHHEIIQDCFIVENKQYYNISYTAPSHPVYVFKSSFNPLPVEYPMYFTLSYFRFFVKIFYFFSVKITPKLKKIIKQKYGNR